MPLPFLKPQRVAGVIVSHRKSDGTKVDEEGQENHGLQAAAEDLIRALNNKDAKAVSEALKAAFEICDSEPHEEGPHTNDYDSQNEIAGSQKE